MNSSSPIWRADPTSPVICHAIIVVVVVARILQVMPTSFEEGSNVGDKTATTEKERGGIDGGEDSRRRETRHDARLPQMTLPLTRLRR